MSVEDFTPTVAEVAAHLRARTKARYGAEVTGSFTADTIPTAAQVTELIPKGVRKVATKIGVEICEGDDADKQTSLYEDAKDLAALYTAMLVERSYFPEQVGSDRSPYDQMRDEWKDGIKTLVEAVSEHCGGGGGESVGGSGAMPSYNFPEASGIGEASW